jgi:hypothetical protein
LKKNGKQHSVYLHRFILGVNDPKIEVDHRDHDGLNCKRENMRTATRSQNQGNMRRHCDNGSGFKGVHFHKVSGLWHSTIQVNGKRKSLGYKKEKEAAAAIYDAAAIEAFGAFALTNHSQ